MKKSSRYIIETIVISALLITTFVLLHPTNGVESQRIYPGTSIKIANYSFEFTLVTDRVWSIGYGELRVLFIFYTYEDILENNIISFELISFVVSQVNDVWKEGTDVNTNGTFYKEYHYTIGRINGPLWDCYSELTVIADITTNLDDNIVYHVEEESSVNCWG